MLPYHLHGLTQHALVQYLSGIAVQNPSHDPFYGSSFVCFYSAEIPSCSIRHLFGWMTLFLIWTPPYFPLALGGECSIFRGGCQSMINASSTLALKLCINF